MSPSNYSKFTTPGSCYTPGSYYSLNICVVPFPINLCEFGETKLGNLSLNFRRNTVLNKHLHKPRPVPHPLTMAETLHTPSLTLTVLVTTLTYTSLPHILTNSHPHQLTPSPRQSSSSSNTLMCHTNIHLLTSHPHPHLDSPCPLRTRRQCTCN